MNLYLLQLITKWVGLFVVSMSSMFGIQITEKKLEITNDNVNKNINVLTQVVPYETIRSYDSSLPDGTIQTITTGETGLEMTLQDGNTIVLKEKVDEEIIVGTGRASEYAGIITGYGPDCSTCSGIGNVACLTKDRKVFNLIQDGIYYMDSEFGSVRVLAAALTKFPCGTIIKVSNSYLGEFLGIVLDTGYDMRKALERGVNHIDVAFSSEKDELVPYITDMSGNVGYSVQRWGW